MTTAEGQPRHVEDLLSDLDRAGWPANGAGRTVLVLDDVVDAGAALAVLERARPASALLTSRHSLPGLAAHRHLDLVCRPGPFAPEESSAFLTGVLGDDRVHREPQAVQRLAAVCRQYPLALRLAATRLLIRPLLRLSDYVDWLAADPVPRLSLGVDDRLSVSTVLGSALDRLPQELAESFLRLGAVDVPDTGVAAEDVARALAEAPEVAAETLERLADAGFLEQGRAGRFHLHALLHDYAAVRRPPPGGPLTAPTRTQEPTHDLTQARTLRRPRLEETLDEYRAG
jgi:hypothetical protein